MTDHIEITSEDIQKCTTYLSVGRKERLTRAIAAFCVEPVEIKVGEGDGIVLPNRVRENRKLRQQYQMGILAWYLGKDYKEQEAQIGEDGETMQLSLCMDEDDFNIWAASHVMNQLERLKKSKDHETANRVFDLLYDYKNIESMLSLAIRDELESRNDPLNRAAEFVMQIMTESTMEEIMAKQKESLSEVMNEAETYAKERKEKNNG